MIPGMCRRVAGGGWKAALRVWSLSFGHSVVELQSSDLQGSQKYAHQWPFGLLSTPLGLDFKYFGSPAKGLSLPEPDHDTSSRLSRPAICFRDN